MSTINEKGQFVARDFTGHRQGMITCIKNTGKKASGGYYIWECICDCGNKVEVTSRRLFNKTGIKSCGCLKLINIGQYQQKDLTGIRNGKLVALRNTNVSNKHGYYMWEFQCDCGNKKIMSSQCFANGTRGTKSCGCLKKGKPCLYENSNINSLFCSRRFSAKKRNLEFKIDREFFFNITKQNCHYCGSPPLNIANLKQSFVKTVIYTGIDRKDSSKGYTEENCVPSCRHCNIAKSIQSYEEFIEWIKKVHDHLKL